jgi:hypothetical protein
MIYIKSTSKPVAPGIYAVDIAAKPPGKTFEVFLAVDGDNPPKEVIAAIEGSGFKTLHSVPYKHVDGKHILDLEFRKSGTDIFEGWTDAERDVNLKAVQKIFADLHVDVTPRVMKMAEAFG